jgi:hypothetical protein
MRTPTPEWSIAVGAAGLLVAGCAGETPDPPAPGTPPATEAPATGEALPLSRQEILAAFAANGLPAEAFEDLVLEDGREVFAASFTRTAGRQALWVGVFGSGAAPHTVRMDLFPIDTGPEEALAIAGAMDGLLSTMFPDWQDAADWPEVAGARAWDQAEELRAKEAGGQRIPILETKRNDVWLGALGVPPDVLSYVFTVREACRPSEASSGFYEGYVGCR